MKRAIILLLLSMLCLYILSTSASGFEAPIYGGGTFKLSDYRGKIVVLIFSQPTCSHCKKFIPLLADAWRTDPELSSGRYVAAVAMYSPSNPQAVLPAFRSYNPPSSWILLKVSWSHFLYFGIQYTATVVIIDPSGNLFAKIEPEDVPYIPDMVSFTVEKVKEAYHRPVDLEVDIPGRVGVGEPLVVSGTAFGVNGVRIVLVSPDGVEEEYSATVSSGHFQISLTLAELGEWIVRVIAGSAVEERKVRAEVSSSVHFRVLYGEHDREAASILGMETMRSGDELPDGDLIILGGPKANELTAQLNEELGIVVDISGSRGIIKARDRVWRFQVEYGRSDYALIASLERYGRRIVLGEGLTRFGTRAAAIKIADGEIDGVIIVRWVDDNGNGEVDPEEVEVIFRGSWP
ncbi:MAG: redoxin domain-containing protein [Candidatus Korarchaeota archaeon]|nr:redoxin domain-containing protein [Candidatus Korarchaeota archaeon]